MFRYDRLDELIAETGKKKNYLSKKMGHSDRYLNDAKKQNTNIKLEEVQILAEELGTSSDYLQGLTDKKEPTLVEDELTDTQKEIMLLARSLSEEQQQQFLRVAKAMFGE